MSDLLFQNLSTGQSNKQPQPPTIASATTIAPTSFISFVSSTTPVTTITPPVTGAHMLVLIPTAALPAMTTTGNIAVVTTTATANVPILFFYNPINGKYYPLQNS